MWLRDSRFLWQSILTQQVDNFESNTIAEVSPSALVRIRSRLIIDHSSSSERTFTCVGRAGGKTAFESTTIYSAPGHKSHNITELMSLNGGAKKPRIVFYYSVLFDTIGTNIELPCKAAGRPNAEIFWLDPDDNVINGRDHRLRVHPSGSLHISSLRWSDMGAYTCIGRSFIFYLNNHTVCMLTKRPTSHPPHEAQASLKLILSMGQRIWMTLFRLLNSKN